VVLGLRERTARNAFAPNRFEISGIVDINDVQKQLWDGINNKQLVNRNILSNEHVRVVALGDGKKLIVITIPRANRKQRPIFIKNDVLKETYRRNFEGDYRCDEETVRRMLADAEYDSLDSRIVPNFKIEDLELDTLSAYRNQVRSTNSTHPYLAYDDLGLLKAIGGYARDRDKNVEGVTLAGLLMFGKHRSILDAVYAYQVDYREASADGSTRWADRLHPDGTWSGNLFDFYRRTILKLTSEVRVPFRILQGQRSDETHVSEALREALVNALIHADYSAGQSIMVEKRHDKFVFRNPGALRVPQGLAFEGNHSDCRNRNLQNMFMLAGAAEKAGSGLPRILRAWTEQQWRLPELSESFEPDQTTLKLTMVSLLPDDSIRRLRERFGVRLDSVDSNEMIALCLADIDGEVSNAAMQQLCNVHPRDITKMFQNLVANDFLVSYGAARGTYYKFASSPAAPVDVSPLPAPSTVASEVQNSAWAPEEKLRAAILELAVDYVTPREFARLLNRSLDTLRPHIGSLLREGLLAQRFTSASHPEQAYRTSKTSEAESRAASLPESES
ncbi:MAG: hypothetical protein M3N13_07970, partial [Candidatus Eremiobacteraeota bacterium]|nr:hypothetical protein [Candidatus Eremiobacteraeota bacterium]